ncbi:hypothetical protein [Rubinisphaera sp. JC750]|uniref:hypothetical protein n=1 Tax=Rubinisphaera sp. JC750 TaxID=2898658 RepID=UPI001F259977|nr:hypothetical protein [Rubinisphaera sp. JC750]
MEELKFTLGELRDVRKLLKRQNQIANWIRELDDKIDQCERQKRAAIEEKTEIEERLNGELSELAEAAKEMMGSTAGLEDDTLKGFKLYNPNYVTNDDKEKLLLKILLDFKRENPRAKGMTFQQILSVLKHRYGVETRTIGNFFRRQLGAYSTEGGNRKKYILLDDLPEDIET